MDNNKLTPENPTGITSVEALHQSIDTSVRGLTTIFGHLLQCRQGCNSCCVDEITVYEVEAARIREKYSHLLDNDTPHAAGACAFLDQRGSCRVYSCRPYVCRTQGLPLQWTEDGDEENIVTYRDICPKNEDSIDVLSLPDDQVWHIGPVEEELAKMQYAKTGAETGRIKLRSLFVNNHMVSES
jgi:Fe-S-cluster containining protein